MKKRWMLLVFICFIALTLVGVDAIQEKNSTQNKQQVEEMLHKTMIQCYALEGRYPVSVAYLEDNYGMTIDHHKYEVYYEFWASNIMPTVKVVYKTWEDE